MLNTLTVGQTNRKILRLFLNRKPSREPQDETFCLQCTTSIFIVFIRLYSEETKQEAADQRGCSRPAAEELITDHRSGNKRCRRPAALTSHVTAALVHSSAFTAVTSAEDPPAPLDLMNEQVFHVEIVILTTYISVSGLLWKSNWRNYRGGGHVSEGQGLSQNTSFPLQSCCSDMETTQRHRIRPSVENIDVQTSDNLK